MKNEKYLLFSLFPETLKLDFGSITVFPNKGEALRAKAFLKNAKMFAVILPVTMLETKDEFKDLWIERSKNDILEAIKSNSDRNQSI